MTDDLVSRLRRCREEAFPTVQEELQTLVKQGQKPIALFIGCSDSRLMPYLITGNKPGEIFMVRNVGAFVPPYDGSEGFHGTSAAIEFAVLTLEVSNIIVCGHSHCGAIEALYTGVPEGAKNLAYWLELGRDARSSGEVTADTLRRTEHRSVLIQLDRLMDYPMVRKRIEEGQLKIHGWHYVIEEGEVYIFDVKTGRFIPASTASESAMDLMRRHVPPPMHDAG